jgi:hypothetical protein
MRIDATNASLYGQNATRLISAFLDGSSSSGSASDLWQMLANRQSDRVTFCLDNVGGKIKTDLATETAEYLSEHPDLVDDYVLVIIDDPDEGREARAYRIDDLTKDLEGEKKTKAEEKLKDKRLLYLTTDEDLPDQPDDKELKGLAEKAQKFLDKNEKVLNLLAKSDILPFYAK